MQIKPQNNKFKIEANIEPQFVDELYPGQLATLRFTAFNQRSTPELSGAVKWISSDIVVNEQTGMSFYINQISVTQEEFALVVSRFLTVPCVHLNNDLRRYCTAKNNKFYETTYHDKGTVAVEHPT
ncbi:MAG: HlyD family secretion protein [Rhizobiales bacterium]|nr:HlyD family secretion protein [Hyphomicrobiales bacterium]